MNVIFYQLNKKHNSTKLPSGTGTTIDCKLKDSCSIIYPSLTLNLGTTTAPSYNYCYISDFGRYYFVNNWTYYQGLWTASLSIDVLATYKTTIGNAEQYVLRSSSLYDTSIIDTTYPIKSNVEEETLNAHSMVTITRNELATTIATSNLYNKSLSNGYIYMSVSNTGGPQLYAMTYGSFQTFYERMIEYIPDDMGDFFADGIKKQLFRPTQYIQTVYWLPFLLPGLDVTSQSSIELGPATLSNVYNSGPINYNESCEVVLGFDVGTHPQSSSIGTYLNTSRFTSMSLVYYPFGRIALNPNDFVGYSTVQTVIVFDAKTGDAELEIRPYDSTKGTGSVVYHTSGKYGLSIPISETDYDFIGMASGVLAGVVGLAGGIGLATAFSGSSVAMAEAYTDEGLKMIGQGGKQLIDTNISSVEKGTNVSSGGSQGNSIQFSYPPHVYYVWNYVTAENKTHRGKPLCAYEKISDIPGFIICDDGDIDVTASQQEKNIIANFLTSGFFYE